MQKITVINAIIVIQDNKIYSKSIYYMNNVGSFQSRVRNNM